MKYFLPLIPFCVHFKLEKKEEKPETPALLYINKRENYMLFTFVYTIIIEEKKRKTIVNLKSRNLYFKSRDSVHKMNVITVSSRKKIVFLVLL